MRRLAMTALALCACHSSSPTHQPVQARSPAASVESCALIGQVKDGKTCAVYDTKAKAFSPTPDGSPEDALARRAFWYERWLDLYASAEHQVVVRNMKVPMAPGDPESRFGDEQYLDFWDDTGDSAGFSDTMMNSVLFHYATTGTDADYQRMEAWLRGQVMQFDATGMPGYLARWHYAAVPDGTQIHNGMAMATGGQDDFDIPADALERMPAYYKTGIDGKTVRPTWHGHTSIDAISGPMNSFPLAYDLVKDPALKARMALHYGCFLKRLKLFKITNLSKNAQLQTDIGRYLNSTILKKDPDDPDLSKLDEVWGFYLPQYNINSAATYPRDCPAHLATTTTEIIDVTRPGYDSKLLDLILRQSDGGNQVNAIDFAFFPNVRSGDAVMLQAFALGAYHMTRDPEFLTWRDQTLIAGANAREVGRTVGEFNPPRPCRSYYRTPNMYRAHLMRTLLDGDDDSRAFAQYLWKQKFALRETAGLRDALFEIQLSAALGTKTAGLPQALQDLMELGGAPGHLDEPRRNYAIDLSLNTPAGYTVEKASADELATCSTPVTLLGINVPIDAPDANALYVRPAPPVMLRPPDNWIWEKDPFKALRYPGDAGRQQYPGVDLLEPYWIARYFGHLPDAHLILAWQ